MPSENFKAVIDLLTKEELQSFKEELHSQWEAEARDLNATENQALKASLITLAQDFRLIVQHFRALLDQYKIPVEVILPNSDSPPTAVFRTPEGPTAVNPALAFKVLKEHRRKAAPVMTEIPPKELAKELPAPDKPFRATREERLALEKGVWAALRSGGQDGIDIPQIVRYLESERHFPVSLKRWSAPVGKPKTPRIVVCVRNELTRLRYATKIRRLDGNRYRLRRCSKKVAT